MRRRPLTLIFCALLFLFFPAELLFNYFKNRPIDVGDVVIYGLLPGILLFGLLRVSRFGWYTLIALTALWGFHDFYEGYANHRLQPLIAHFIIYFISLIYFINPRVRHLYFDPKLRWWRLKPRYETHLPLALHIDSAWNYPVLGNLSEGGCFIETHQPEFVGTEVLLKIPLPAPLNLSVIEATGVVRWVSLSPAKRGMGVEFGKISPEVGRALKLFVRHQL